MECEQKLPELLVGLAHKNTSLPSSVLFLPSQRSWNLHVEGGEALRWKELEFLNYYLEQNQPLSKNTYLNFKRTRNTFLFC